MQGLSPENHEISLREIEEDLNKQGEIPYSRKVRLNVKIAYHPTLMY